MGGRGSKGKTRAQAPMPKDPVLPPEATFRPEEPDEPAPEQDPPGGLEARIHAAYKELSVKEQDWIRLSKLREKLDNPDSAELERILRAMTRTGLVHLAPCSNRKAHTDADRAAAIRIGSEDKHLLAIEPDYYTQHPPS